MPSITTHNIFAKEVLNHLNEEYVSKINQDIYYIFAQSHDLLFYYTFDFKNSKKIKETGHNAHHNKTQAYIINILKEIKNNNLENNADAIAYLYGVITHYALDTTCHPYIFYKTGIYRKSNKNSLKYRGEHTRMEKNIDAYYYQKYYGKSYNHCNLNKEMIKNPQFSSTLINLINNVYIKTYNVENIGYYYYKSIKHLKLINTIIINDYFGIKRLIYKLIDFVSNHKFGNLASYSTHIINPDKSFLNEEHHSWNHPSIKVQTFTYSFQDLFDISLKKALSIISKINEVLYKNKSIEDILKYIPNIDYATGLEIENNIRMDYFAE